MYFNPLEFFKKIHGLTLRVDESDRKQKIRGQSLKDRYDLVIEMPFSLSEVRIKSSCT
jgi:hypothetical protein